MVRITFVVQLKQPLIDTFTFVCTSKNILELLIIYLVTAFLNLLCNDVPVILFRGEHESVSESWLANEPSSFLIELIESMLQVGYGRLDIRHGLFSLFWGVETKRVNRFWSDVLSKIIAWLWITNGIVDHSNYYKKCINTDAFGLSFRRI